MKNQKIQANTLFFTVYCITLAVFPSGAMHLFYNASNVRTLVRWNERAKQRAVIAGAYLVLLGAFAGIVVFVLVTAGWHSDII